MPTSIIGTVVSQDFAWNLTSSPGGEPTSSESSTASETATGQPLGESGGSRYSTIGTALEVGHAQSFTGRKTGHKDFNLPYSPAIGMGTWKAYIVGRGGSPMKHELPFSVIQMSRIVDASAATSVDVASSGPASANCAQIISDTEPWRDELLLYRDNDIAFVGPIVTLEATDDGARIDAQDLFYWMERRFNDIDRVYWDDLAYTFRDVFEALMAPDPSPNVEVQVHPTGIKSFRRYLGTDVQRGADILRELSRTGLDFTTIGRTVYVGGKEVFIHTSDIVHPIILHDGGVSSMSVTKDGNLFATDVAVFSGSAEEDGFTRDEALVGRDIGDTTFYGLVQQVFTELYIKDLETANDAARARRLAMSPAPLRVHATLTPQSAFTFRDLIPGRRVDVRLANGPLPVMEEMRLAEATISVDETGESVEIDLIPMGLSDLEIE